MPLKKPSIYFSQSKVMWMKYILIVLGGCFIALFSGTNNAFDFFALEIQRDLGLTEYQISWIEGMGFIGVYFVLPAGIIYDRYGAVVLNFVSVFLIIGGYIGMAYCTNWVLLLICFSIAGFGCGGTFMGALGVSIAISPTGGGFAVSIVSSCMSISIALTIQLISSYQSITGCTENHCWREYIKFLVISSVIFILPGIFLLLFFKKSDYPHLQKLDLKPLQNEASIPIEKKPLLEGVDDDTAFEDKTFSQAMQDHDYDEEESYLVPTQPLNLQSKKNKGFIKSLRIFKDPSFWSLFFGFFVGIGTSVFILSETSQLWDTYNKDSSLKPWADRILFIFSIMNAVSNVLSGMASDFLSRKEIMRNTTFLGIIELIFAGVFATIGVLQMIDFTHTRALALIWLMALTGLGFGVYLVLFSVCVAEFYGMENFGIYLSYLQFASSVATILFPQIAAILFKATSKYIHISFVSAALLFIGGVILIAARYFPKKPKGRFLSSVILN